MPRISGVNSSTIGRIPKLRLETGSGEDRKMVDIIMLSDHPELFDVQARQPILTKTEDGITVSIAYWRRPDLDRKYNRGNAFSPFYETEALHQGDKTDVFYVKITNNRSETSSLMSKNAKSSTKTRISITVWITMI